MELQIDQRDYRRIEELAKREGKAVEDLAAEILHQALVDRDQKGNWLNEVAGSFENDPEFDEVVRLGKELRKADRPGSGD
jgi:hypothetical protein